VDSSKVPPLPSPLSAAAAAAASSSSPLRLKRVLTSRLWWMEWTWTWTIGWGRCWWPRAQAG
jgi:hypothetical protein